MAGVSKSRGGMADRSKTSKAIGKGKHSGNTDTKGLTVTRSEDLGLWWSEMLTKAGIVSYYDVQGCYILDPPLIFA